MPAADNTYNLGSTSSEWAHIYGRTIAARHLDADAVYTGDHYLYIGYGASGYTTATKMYYSSSTSSRTQFFEINSNGAYALTRFGVNGQSTSYNFYVNGTSYFNDDLFLPNDVAIIQKQNSTSNYTAPIAWYKGGTSQNTYNPQIGQHNTGGDGTGSICILPYATATSPWGGTVGLFIQKSHAYLDGVELVQANSGTWDINISGNAATATKWATARNFYISDNSSAHTGPAVSVNGSGNATIKLPATITATLVGNADTATKATNDSDGNAINTTYLKKRSMLESSVSSATTGTNTGTQSVLRIYGQTYGNDSTYLTTSGKLSYGDPGPQIQFSSSASAAQDAALIYTDHDTIGTGVSLSFVTNQSDAYFIAPHIKALSGFIGDLSGNATSAGNADTVDNIHASGFKTRITNAKYLNVAGWYRILDVTKYSNTFLITFYGEYNYCAPTPVTFLVSHSYNKTKISQIGGCAYVGWITQIRAVHHDTYKFYIDVYFALTSGSNGVNFEITPLDPNARSYISIVDYTSITDSVTANASCSTTLNSVSDQVGHTLTIGSYTFDGSADVSVPVYAGSTS